MTIEPLPHLLAQNYSITPTNLISIHLFESKDRGVYKVERAKEPPLLLRACRIDTWMAEKLAETAEALNALAAVGYPAPIVQRTNSGSNIAKDGEWMALLLTFIEGELAVANLADMHAMGETLAHLHRLDNKRLRELEPSIPACRWHPKTKLAPWLVELESVADLIPPELESRYRFCIDTLNDVLAWPELPISILHTDCNPQNAIRESTGQMTFIDWDGIGFGPAVMDLAYLIFHCHILQESWPVIVPQREWINAITQGYCAYRPLSPIEREYLFGALSLAECHHLARSLPNAVKGDWTQNRALTRFYDREKIVMQIADLTLEAL